ncbi:MAG TPA: hypothetical protein VIL47_06770 [Candidatus Bipolaricaulota bacterium]
MGEAGCICPTRVEEDLQAILDDNLARFRKGQERRVRFPKVRARLGAELLSTFSHLTPNLPIDEVWGNYVLLRLQEALGLPRDKVLNLAYDNYIPRADTPKAFTLQFGIVSLKALDPLIIPNLQDRFAYDRDKFFSPDGQNRVKSAPEQNIPEFRQRFDQLDAIYARYAGEGEVARRLLDLRRDLLGLLGYSFIPELAYSKHLQPCTADVLEMLEAEGFPFWELPVPDSGKHYVQDTFLIEGINARKQRVPVRYEGGTFRYAYGPGETRSLSAKQVYQAMRDHQVIPTMPLVILTLVTAPQMPHMGGRVWQDYAPCHVELQARWLGIEERADTLIYTTGGKQPLRAFRHNEEFIGFPVLYLTYGRETFGKALEEGVQMRVEFKRRVIA